MADVSDGISLLWLSSSEVLKFMSMLKNEMLIWKSWRREWREDEGIQVMFQPTKIIAILIGFDLVVMFNVSSMYPISWHTLVASADRTNLLRLNLKANSSFRIPKNQPPDFARSESSSNSRGCNQLHSQLPSECNNFQSTRVYGDYQLKIPNWISLGPVTLG